MGWPCRINGLAEAMGRGCGQCGTGAMAPARNWEPHGAGADWRQHGMAAPDASCWLPLPTGLPHRSLPLMHSLLPVACSTPRAQRSTTGEAACHCSSHFKSHRHTVPLPDGAQPGTLPCCARHLGWCCCPMPPTPELPPPQPSTLPILHRYSCVAMLARLWHAPSMADGQGDPVGTACIGSSEAIMLGGERGPMRPSVGVVGATLCALGCCCCQCCGAKPCSECSEAALPGGLWMLLPSARHAHLRTTPSPARPSRAARAQP